MRLTLCKRLTALLLLTALVLSLLSGCGREPVNKDSGDTPTAPTAEPVTIDPLPADKALQSLPTRAPGDGSTREYTVMLYLVGSDLESNYGCASADLQEIMESGLDTSRVNLLVYTGGARYWQLEIPSDCNVVYQLTAAGLQEVAATATANNMGDPATFLDFMTYAYQNYPARHYGMICWDHGGGPLGGYGVDELFDSDRLYLQEMEAAFAASPFASEKLDFLGFDACLMATLETAEMAKGYADYLIASEETEPGSGWDYSFLQTLNTSSDTKTIAQSILRTYEASMDAYRFTPDYTLSALDLSQLSGFSTAADKLFAQMAAGVTGGSFSKIAQARQQMLRFALSSTSAYDLVDMGSMARSLDGLYSTEAAALQTQLGRLVTGQVSNITGTTGLAIYFPYDNKDMYQAIGEAFYPQLTDCTGYETFVAAFTDYWINGEPAADFTEHEVEQPAVTTPTPTPATPVTQPEPNSDLSLQLTSDQLSNLSDASYTIFSYSIDASSGQAVYTPVLRNIPLEPDSTGTVRLPDSQQLIVMRTDEETEGMLWPATRIPSSGGTHYISLNACLTATLDTVDGVENMSIYFSEGNTSRMNILSMTTQGNTDATGRAEPTLEHWEYIAHRYTTLFPTCSNAGTLTAYTLWDDSGDEYYSLLSYDEEFWLEQVPMESLEGDFYYQIVLTDTQGNTYGSQLARFPKGQDYTELTQNGMTFYVYADHAELASYDGTGGSVTIPAQAGGKDVTAVRSEAFYYNYDITAVTLPATVQTIGARAFSGCRNLTNVLFLGSVRQIQSEAFSRTGLTAVVLPEGLERIEYGAFANCTSLPVANIPASVSYIGSGAFAGCTQLLGLTVDHSANGSSRYFKAVDGTLLTADGRELVQAPLSTIFRLTVPAGVEVIRSGAVRGSESLREVILPEGLKEIGSYAFYDTVGLQSLTLPDSLEVIGHSAFGTFSVSINEASPVTSVAIGPNVRWIGYNAFDAFPISTFIVHGMNEHYSASGGHLLNKAGTVYLHAPYTWQGPLEIPKGVSHLAFHSLYKCDGITELILPDTVVSMDAGTGLPDSLQKLTVGKGLTCWDNISDTYHIAQVQISTANPNFVIKDSCIYSADMTTLYAVLDSGAVLNIPEGVTTIADNAFCPASASNQDLTEIRIPSTVTFLSGELFRNLPALQKVEVASGNASYASYDGMVYTKNGVSLILCPQGKTGTVQVREGTATIWRYAFYGQLQASQIILPESIMTIRKGNFVSYRSTELQLQLPGSLEKIYPDMFRSPANYLVTCPAGSTADTFARSRGVSVTN